jgi:hypothetical protein
VKKFFWVTIILSSLISCVWAKDTGSCSDTVVAYPCLVARASPTPVPSPTPRPSPSPMFHLPVPLSSLPAPVGYRSTSTLTIWTESAISIVLSDGATNKTFTQVSVRGSVSASGAGGLDTGTVAPSTTYYRYVIGKTDGTVDCLISLSKTSPFLPSGYTLFHCVGILMTNSSSQIVHYGHWGNSYIHS